MRAFAFSVLMAVGASPAMAATDDAVRARPEEIAAILTATERPATVKAADDGERYVEATFNGRNFRVYFYNCGEGVRADNCTSIQLYIAFTIGTPFPAERINEWNMGHRFGRAYVDAEKDPAMEMDINLDGAGMSRALFLDTLDIWTDVMTDFDDFVFDSKPQRVLDGKSAGKAPAD